MIAQGTPSALKRTVGGERLELELTNSDDVARTTALIATVLPDAPPASVAGTRLVVAVDHGAKALLAVLNACATKNIDVQDVAMRRPTLDDVFLSLTGDTASTPVTAKGPS
ncbi:MAG: DUF4162 domain-containing protein [Nitriliruptoraceae bacterium]